MKLSKIIIQIVKKIKSEDQDVDNIFYSVLKELIKRLIDN